MDFPGKMWLFKKTNKRDHAVWHSLALFAQDYQVSYCRWGGSVRFPTLNRSPPRQRDKGQRAGRRTCLWSSNQEDPLKAILAARLCLRKSLFLSVPKGLPRSHFWSHTEIWTICWFHPLNTCSWIRDYTSTHLTATALFWCVAMEFQKQNKENHCSVIVTKLLSPSTENQV